MKKILSLALALVLAAVAQAIAVEDGLGTNHVRTLKAYDGIVLGNQKIGTWQEISTSTLTNQSITTGMIQDGAVTTGKVAAAVAGDGLVGGGAAALAVGAGSGIAVTADAVAVDATVVRTSGAFQLGGPITFTNQVAVPTSTNSGHAASVAYVDGKLSSSVAAGASANDSLRWTGSAWTNTSGFTVDASGNSAVAGTLKVTGVQTNASDVVVEGKASVAGTLRVTGAQTNVGDLAVQGNVTLGDSGGDSIAFNGTASTNLAMGTYRITGLGTPTAATDAANKLYVDSAINGLSWKQAVKVSSTGNIAALTGVSAGNTLDGVALLANDRVLLKDQGTASANGLYVVQGAGVAPVRAADMTNTAHLAGAAVFVSQGTANGGTAWVCTSPNATVGSGAITFAQFASPGTYAAGTGLQLAGLTFSVNPSDFTGAGLEVNGGAIRVAASSAGDGLTGGGAAALAVNPGSGIAIVADAVTVDASVVRTNGAQTIAGAKTFSDFVVVPTPTNASHAATMGYVDGKLSSSVAAGSSANDTLRWTGSAWTNTSAFTVDASGNTVAGGTLRVGGVQTNVSDVVVEGKASVAGTLRVTGAQTNVGDLAVQGNVTLGDSGGDSIAFNGTASTNLAMGTYRITGLGTPTAATDAANKLYVDSAINGLSWKQAVKVSSTGNIAALTGVSAGNTLDGVALLANDRVLLKDQGTASANGLYVVQGAGVAPVRAADMTNTAHLAGAAVFVSQGTANGGTAWVCTSPNATVGSGAITFAQFASPGTYTAGDGIEIAGLEIKAKVSDLAGTGLESDGANNLRIAATTAGAGLTGGGAAALAVGQGDGIAVSADAIAVDASVVRTNGAQTISGAKTFTDFVVVPTPTNAAHAATMGYVDGKLSSSVAAGAAANDTLRWTGSAWTNTGAFKADASGNLVAAGAVTASGAVTVASATQSTGKDDGALVVEGGAGIEKNLNVGGALGVTGAVAIASATASTDKDTGALVVEGGAGIEGNLNAGGNVGAAGNLTVGGNTALGNDIAVDTVSVTAKVTIAGAVVTTPSDETQIAAGSGVTATHIQRSYLKVRGNSGAVDITANPQIAAGMAGQMLTLQGTDDTNTLKLDDGTGLALAGGVSFTLKQGHLIQFIYDGAAWRELSRTVPAP